MGYQGGRGRQPGGRHLQLAFGHHPQHPERGPDKLAERRSPRLDGGAGVPDRGGHKPLSPDVVKLAFAALLVVLAYPTARGRPPFAETSFKMPTVLVLVAGDGIGTLSGLVGVGGGVLMVPLMVLGLGMRTKAAVSTSLVVALAIGTVGTAGYLTTGFGRLSELLPLIVGSVIGA